ncbi:MAG: S-methyl-5'-thioinosine phosphorylase [Betaproteobacteria bacterium]|nr:S-methyl-5'-thioinosine phosphorylase [Betaproteobacteria bacterium]
MLAIIGGSGLTQLANLEVTHRQIVRTPWGEPSGPLTFGLMQGKEVMFLARHGYGHTIPPHRVNYRANIWALKEYKAKQVVSVASVGGIGANMKPGVLAIPRQIIDYTHGRQGTFFEGEGSGDERAVVHIDFTHPYDQALRVQLLQAAKAISIPVIDGGVYATTQGPRLETAAEINRLERDGADMVGMTGMPEAALAREIGLPYAAVAVVANHAAGRADSESGVHLDAIHAILKDALRQVRGVIEQLLVTQ